MNQPVELLEEIHKEPDVYQELKEDNHIQEEFEQPQQIQKSKEFKSAEPENLPVKSGEGMKEILQKNKQVSLNEGVILRPETHLKEESFEEPIFIGTRINPNGKEKYNPLNQILKK